MEITDPALYFRPESRWSAIHRETARSREIARITQELLASGAPYDGPLARSIAFIDAEAVVDIYDRFTSASPQGDGDPRC